MRLLEQRTQRRRTQPQGCCRRNRVCVWWTSRSLGQWRLLLRGRDQPDVNSFLGINVSSVNCITHGLDLTISKTLLSMFNMLPFQTSSQRCKPSKCTLEETLGFKKKEENLPGIENEMSMPYGDTCQALANLNFPIMREGHTEFEDTP